MTDSNQDSLPLSAQSLQASLTVNDLALSLAWYRDALGFEVDREHRRDDRLFAVSLRAGTVRLLLTQDNGARGAERAKGAGFSLQITTSQSIDAIAARVARTGTRFETEPTDAMGVRMFRVRDPNGFLFVISSPRPAT